VVEVFHYRSRMASGHARYRVVREGSQWVCLGPMIRMAPD
jgi:hypothetical protein